MKQMGVSDNFQYYTYIIYNINVSEYTVKRESSRGQPSCLFMMRLEFLGYHVKSRMELGISREGTRTES